MVDEIADHAAAVAAHFVQVPVEQQQKIVDGDILAAFVHDGDAVGVAIHGQAEVVTAVAHGGAEQPQRFGIGRGRAAAEERIVPLMDERHAAAGFGEHRAESELADAVHGVYDDFEPGVANGREVDQRFHGVHVLVGEIACVPRCRLRGARSSSSLMTCSGVSALVSVSMRRVSGSSSSEPSP